MTATLTYVVGVEPPRTSQPADGNAARFKIMSAAAAANPGQWVKFPAVPSSSADRLKKQLQQQFGHDITVRYGDCRQASGTRRFCDMYVRLCCKVSAPSADRQAPVSLPPSTDRRWFARTGVAA